MNIWQIGFVVRSGVSAPVVAFLLGYAAHYQWGFMPGQPRCSMGRCGSICTRVAIAGPAEISTRHLPRPPSQPTGDFSVSVVEDGDLVGSDRTCAS
jgi:hypothetical protein